MPLNPRETAARQKNPQTWTRLTRLDLRHLSTEIGNLALENLRHWTRTGEGRAVKSASEEINRILDATLDRSDIYYALDNLESVTDKFIEIERNPFFQKHISGQVYKDRKGRKSQFSGILLALVKEVKTYAIEQRSRREKVESNDAPSSKESVDVAEAREVTLSDLVPNQQAAPLQFHFSNNKLKIRRQTTSHSESEALTTAAARNSIALDILALKTSLQNSNCDLRIIDYISELGEIVESQTDIIRLGLFCFTCNSLFDRFSDEIPSVILAQYTGVSLSIAMYVSQFSEWQTFSANSADLNEVSKDQVRNIVNVTTMLASELETTKELVDPEVPKSIKLLAEAMHDPQISKKRLVYGLVRTLENLISSVFVEFSDYIKNINQGAKDGLKKGVAVLVASSLLLTVANTALELSPTAESIARITWLKGAGKLVKDAIFSAK